MEDILLTILIMGVLGALIGIFLIVAGKKFAVHEDEKVLKIREALPGNNCGGCGFAGCGALA
jgi:Na+-translocating ferredoxin:NAD+ oxidoreductase RNF subunit RnfB